MTFNHRHQNLPSALTSPRQLRRLKRRNLLRAEAPSPRLEVLENRVLFSFSPFASLPVGMTPMAVASADLNNDGHVDLMTANVGDNTVSVLLGNGDGTFQPVRSSAAGQFPLSLAAGDFNGDGASDLAVGNFDEHGLGILLGNGDGTFADPVPQSIGSDLISLIATGDINADGVLDLVVTSDDGSGFFGGSIHVLLGNGDGSFITPAIYGPDPVQYSAPVLADLDSDGHIDVVAAVDTGTVRVFMGNGDGTLRQPDSFAIDMSAISVAVGDFNADGIPDLATTGYSGTVNVLIGSGDGTFESTTTIAIEGFVDPVNTGDLNSDGLTDLVITHATSPGTVSVLIGNGDGSFAPQVITEVGTTAGGAALVYGVVADFNGDGRQDVATTGADPDAVSVLLNDGDWPSAPATPPAVNIANASIREGSAGTHLISFAVTLSAASTQPVTVNFATANGTATAGSDYQTEAGTLVFTPGETSKAIDIVVQGDTMYESNESFLVNLSVPVGATIADGQAVGTIVNDDLPPRITIDDVYGNEGNTGTTPFVFTVRLSNASTSPVTVKYATANSTATTTNKDYKATSGTLTFASGETNKTITVLATGDRRGELHETFLVNLSGATNATIADSQGVGVIMDDEPRLTINDASILEGQSNMVALVFTVTLSAAYDMPVTFSFATANGSATASNRDYKAISGKLTFAPGEISKTITVWVYGDTKTEGNESLYLNLSGVTNSLISRSRGIGTVLNDD